MKEPAETTAERKEGRGVWMYVYWVGVVLLLYVLGSGPAARLAGKGDLKEGSIGIYLYYPLIWAYWHTPLHKPLGMYIHLWDPVSVGEDGDARIKP